LIARTILDHIKTSGTVRSLLERFAPPYFRRNERKTCVCGAARAFIQKRLWRVTDNEVDPIFPKYYYRCPQCGSFSAVNLYFPVDKYEEMPLEAMHISDIKKCLNVTRITWIEQHAELPEDTIAFDLGAGEGCFSHAFSASHPKATVFAVEADARIEDKFYTTNDRVIFVPMYIEDFLRRPPMNVAGRHPDLVVLTDVLEHVLAPEQILEAVARTLAPGGVAYLTVPDANTFQAPHPYPARPGTIDWQHANRTCQHLWMMQPETFFSMVSEYFDVVAESQSLETDIRKDSVYTTILARKSN
jgi:2-polyprenyl-3-methyl-5-hydroxy-6-metoxy-1,4-benzoquinol methylase